MGLRYPKGFTVPSEPLADIDIGMIFSVGEKKHLYLLVARDPWKATYVKWHWFNQLRIQGPRLFFKEFWKAKKQLKSSTK